MLEHPRVEKHLLPWVKLELLLSLPFIDAVLQQFCFHGKKTRHLSKTRSLCNANCGYLDNSFFGWVALSHILLKKNALRLLYVYKSCVWRCHLCWTFLLHCPVLVFAVLSSLSSLFRLCAISFDSNTSSILITWLLLDYPNYLQLFMSPFFLFNDSSVPVQKAACHFETHSAHTEKMHTKYLECKDKPMQRVNTGQRHIHNKILLTSIIGKSSD